jgi:cytochrome oxidase Cu insertion factor (SCO1/SenC/PrrC family)
VEDRIDAPSPERRGGVLIALAAILAITAAWWALALWPSGSTGSSWLARTQAACFGSEPGGLPDAGGWVLLIGEPLGMLLMAGVVWGRSLRRDFEWIARSAAPRFAVLMMAALTVAGIVAAGRRVAELKAMPVAEEFVVNDSRLLTGRPAPAFALVDQQGRRAPLDAYRGGPLLLTFAYGHCATACPLIVHKLLTARTEARIDIPIVVVTVDPWRDTPAQLPAIARAWQLGPTDRVLSGRVADVERVLALYGTRYRRNEQTREVDHSTTTFIIDERGLVVGRLIGTAFGPGDLGAGLR